MTTAESTVQSPGESEVLHQLAAAVRPWRALIASVALLVVLSAIMELGPPLILKRIVDDHLTTGKREGLLFLALLYLGATAAVQALTFAYGYTAAVVAQRALNSLRVRLFAHLQDLPMVYHDRTPLGDSISRCTADVETVDTMFSTGVATLVANMVRVLTVGFAMIVLSPPLALVSALVLPPLVAITRFFQVRVRDAERHNRTAVGLMNAHLQETLGGVEVIRAFGQEGHFGLRFRRTLLSTLTASNRSSLYSSLYTPATAILAALVTAILLVAGTRHALASWGISIGTLTAFIILFQNFFKPITDLGDQWQTVQSALSGAERIFHVLALPSEQASGEGDAIEVHASAPVELRDVVFGYLENRPVLHSVSITINRGEQVALVGRTGAGKTSTLHLIAGLYDPWHGSVRVLGFDPRTLAEDERRRLIGAVPQVVQLFSGSIFENLTLRDGSPKLADVERAVEIVGLSRLIHSLPEDYNTQLSGGGRGLGIQLSAGEQQLLALARALVWDPRLILLDEATSTVDSASDAAFRAALKAMVRQQGKAVLTIAHRLSTARDADRVIVMDNGRIVEEGKPEELVRAGGRFAALLELEASGWDWKSGPPELEDPGLRPKEGVS